MTAVPSFRLISSEPSFRVDARFQHRVGWTCATVAINPAVHILITMPRPIYQVQEVFTPSMPARLTFVERDPHVNDDLVDALRTPGKQIVVYGHTGSGKTTLLVNLLDRLYEGYIRVICDKRTTIDAILRQTMDNLGAIYEASRQSTRSQKTAAGVKARPLPGINVELSGSDDAAESVTRNAVVEPQITAQRVAEALGECRCCLLLEDFYKLPPAEKERMTDVMKVFVDVASAYPDVKLIATGAVGTAREVVQYEPTMRDRVAEVLVPLMAPAELRQILDKGEKHLHLAISSVVKDSILEYAGGLPAVCHQLALNMCSEAGVAATTNDKIPIQVKHLTVAVRKYLNASSDSLKLKFDRAFHREKDSEHDHCREILTALASFSQEGASFSELLAKVRERLGDYHTAQFSQFVKELQRADRGEIVVYDTAAGRYSFADPLDRAFMKLLVEKPRIPAWQRQGRLSDEVMDQIIGELHQVYLGRFKQIVAK